MINGDAQEPQNCTDRAIYPAMARTGGCAPPASDPDQFQRSVAAAGQARLAEDQLRQPQPDQLVGVVERNTPAAKGWRPTA